MFEAGLRGNGLTQASRKPRRPDSMILRGDAGHGPTGRPRRIAAADA